MRNTYCFTILFVIFMLTPVYSLPMFAPVRLLTRAVVATPLDTYRVARWSSDEASIAHIMYYCADLQEELRYVRCLAKERDRLATEMPFLEDIHKLSHYFDQEKNDTLTTKIKTYKRNMKEYNQWIAVQLRVYINPTIEKLEKINGQHKHDFSLHSDLTSLITSIKRERLDLIEETIKISKNNS